MRKKFLLILSILLLFAGAFVVYSCTSLKKPQNLKIENDILTWNAVDGATGYQVKLYSYSYGKTANSVIKDVKTNSFKIDIVGYGYYYDYCLEVKAIGKTNSDWSNYIKWDGQKEDDNGLLFAYSNIYDDYYEYANGYYIVCGINNDVSGHLEIPSMHNDGVNGNCPVTEIYGGFSDCINLTTVAIPNCVTELGSSFENCGIWNNAPDNSVVYAGNWVIGYKGTLQANLVLKSSTVGIQSWAFHNCTSITSVSIPEGVKQIGRGTFYGCSNLANVSIPKSVTKIGDGVFGSYYTNNPAQGIIQGATKIWNDTPDDSIVYVDNWAVGYKGFTTLNTITIKDGTVGLADNLFEREYAYSYFLLMNVNSIVLPSSLKYIGRRAFCIPSNSYLHYPIITANVPVNVIYIGYCAFAYWGWNGEKSIINMQGRADVSLNWNKGWDTCCEAKINWNV